MHQGLNVSTLQRCGNEKTRRPRRKENPITLADDWIRYAGMNKIFEQVDRYMHESLRKGLPDIKPCDLEKDGAVFYMNGKNGMAFDWYVNEHFPYFFIFYNDKENLGAVKAALYTDGGLTVYVYGEKGHAEPLHFAEQVQATSEELLDLAVLLTAHADGEKIWDEDIRILDAEGRPEAEEVDLFLSLEEAHRPMIERRDLLPKTVIVTKKAREGGWKIGYGLRDEPTNERDSGWFFSVGDETDEYVNDPGNLELWVVNSALIYDPALTEFITAPYGTTIVRVSSDRFEPDEPGKEIFIEKN